MDIGFYSDASTAKDLGFRAVLKTRWIKGLWPEGFIQAEQPSIKFLELFTLTVGILVWQQEDAWQNAKICVHCDNQAVVQMINNLSSSCAHCMTLLRILVLNGLKFNQQLYAKWIDTKSNYLSDALSCNQMVRFRKLGPQMNKMGNILPSEIWPIDRIWNCNFNWNVFQ